jgi:hypothetical protein
MTGSNRSPSILPLVQAATNDESPREELCRSTGAEVPAVDPRNVSLDLVEGVPVRDNLLKSNGVIESARVGSRRGGTCGPKLALGELRSALEVITPLRLQSVSLKKSSLAESNENAPLGPAAEEIAVDVSHIGLASSLATLEAGAHEGVLIPSWSGDRLSFGRWPPGPI